MQGKPHCELCGEDLPAFIESISSHVQEYHHDQKVTLRATSDGIHIVALHQERAPSPEAPD